MIVCLALPENFWGTVISTLLGVTVGFVLNYIRDLQKSKKEKKIKKAEIIRMIVSTCSLYEQYAFMLFEVISTNNFFKSRNHYIEINEIEDKKIPIEMLESWRKDYENYRLKLIEFDSTLSEYISEYHTYFGKDKIIDAKRNKIVLMDCGFIYTFDTLEKVKNYSEQEIYKGICIELNKEGKIAYLLKDLVKYVQELKY